MGILGRGSGREFFVGNSCEWGREKFLGCGFGGRISHLASGEEWGRVWVCKGKLMGLGWQGLGR